MYFDPGSQPGFAAPLSTRGARRGSTARADNLSPLSPLSMPGMGVSSGRPASFTAGTQGPRRVPPTPRKTELHHPPLTPMELEAPVTTRPHILAGEAGTGTSGEGQGPPSASKSRSYTGMAGEENSSPVQSPRRWSPAMRPSANGGVISPRAHLAGRGLQSGDRRSINGRTISSGGLGSQQRTNSHMPTAHSSRNLRSSLDCGYSHAPLYQAGSPYGTRPGSTAGALPSPGAGTGTGASIALATAPANVVGAASAWGRSQSPSNSLLGYNRRRSVDALEVISPSSSPRDGAGDISILGPMRPSSPCSPPAAAVAHVQLGRLHELSSSAAAAGGVAAMGAANHAEVGAAGAAAASSHGAGPLCEGMLKDSGRKRTDGLVSECSSCAMYLVNITLSRPDPTGGVCTQ